MYSVAQRSSNNARNMAAHFKAYQDRATKSHTLRPPAHETTRPQHRRRTPNPPTQRTKSSKLPLERVPHGYHIQNLVLPLQLRVASIVYSARKLDMRSNSLEWGYGAEDGHDVFASRVAETRIVGWVGRVDGVLSE